MSNKSPQDLDKDIDSLIRNFHEADLRKDTDQANLKAAIKSMFYSHMQAGFDDVIGEDSTTSNGIPLENITREATLDPWLPANVENKLRDRQREKAKLWLGGDK